MSTGLDVPAAAVSPRSSWRTAALVGAMVLAVAAVALLAFWAEQRESAAALEDFARQQPTLARALAIELRTQLAAARAVQRRSPELTRQLLSSVAEVQRPNGLVVLLRPPGSRELLATDGRARDAAALVRALDAGELSLRLRPPEAARLGLPQRTALAGLATVDGGPLGRWGIAAVASAERERDREQRARRRLLVSIILAGGLVLAFGGVSLLMQRKELALQHQLVVAGLVQQRDERLARANRAATLGTLAMGIAHEASTPLGVITGRAEQLLPKLTDDERGTRAVRAILEQAEAISQIIRAFLGLVRGDSPPAQQVDLLAVLRAAASLVEHRLIKAGVQLDVDAPQAVPLLHGDPHLLQQALVNLLLNACEASGPGGHIEVRLLATPSCVQLMVDDDGQGISAAAAERATEPFFTTKRQGTGLGLAIASEIVKGHGGKLSIAPRTTGRGTEASIELPLAGRESHEATS